MEVGFVERRWVKEHVTVGFGGMQGRGKEWDVDIILSQPAVSIWYECDDW